MATPHPTPTPLKVLRGNPGRRPLPSNEPHPRPNIGPAPRFLEPAARAEWKKMAPRLKRLGLATEIDGAVFALYCSAYAEWADATARLATEGKLVTTPNGFLQPSPWLAIRNRAAADMLRAATHFGMSPSTRATVTPTTVTANEEDEFAESFVR